MDKIKNIVYAGTAQGWSYNNIIGQIMYALATDDEAERLFICGEEDSIPDLRVRAEKLYNEYREEYYNEY